jgi:glycosyltransferase involved in cell wall biosynthesis
VLEAHLQYFCNRCDATIVPTEHVRTKLVEWGVETPIYTIPTGIELEPFQKHSHEEARRWLLEEHSIPKDRFLLLFVGRLAQEKNLEHLLSELVRLRTLEGAPKDRDVHLVVVGEGPHEETLVERVEEQRLTDNVTFAGTVSWEQVTRYYRGADTFAFPGVSETQGIVLVEALAAGLPIVALSSPATREIVRSGVEGLLVSDRQGALARALEQLKTSSRMQRLFSEAASSRAERFAASQTAAQVEELYREIKTDFKPRRNLGETALALFQSDVWEPSNDK